MYAVFVFYTFIFHALIHATSIFHTFMYAAFIFSTFIFQIFMHVTSIYTRFIFPHITFIFPHITFIFPLRIFIRITFICFMFFLSAFNLIPRIFRKSIRIPIIRFFHNASFFLFLPCQTDKSILRKLKSPQLCKRLLFLQKLRPFLILPAILLQISYQTHIQTRSQQQQDHPKDTFLIHVSSRKRVY